MLVADLRDQFVTQRNKQRSCGVEFSEARLVVIEERQWLMRVRTIRSVSLGRKERLEMAR